MLPDLERDDKWYVGGGRSSVYAPPAPLWPDSPGFWDEVHLGTSAIPRLFTFTLLDDGGSIPLRLERRSWRPERLQHHFSGPGISLVETKVNLRPDVFVSRVEIRSERPGPLHLLAWTWQPQRESGERAEDVGYHDGHIRYTWRRDTPPGWVGTAPPVYVALSGMRPADSYSINLSEGHHWHPDWRFSTLLDKWRGDSLPNESRINVGVTETRNGATFPAGNLHMSLHWQLEGAAGQPIVFALGAALGFDEETCVRGLGTIGADAPEQSAAAWQGYFEAVPQLQVADPFLNTFYWYRWYQQHIHEVDAQVGGFSQPCVLEGIGYFRNHISYSAHAHMREQSWRHNPAFAWGSLRNLFAAQHRNGWLPGTLNEIGERAPGPTGGAFYHARWSNVWQLYLLHNDLTALETIYKPLRRYARYFERKRDREKSGLFDVIGQDETGQEFMSRYQAVNRYADDWGSFRLKGVDATCYMYELYRALSNIALQLNKPKAAARWQARAERTRAAVHRFMWDEASGMFSDVNPKRMERTGVKAAVCFYPFLSDLAGPEHLRALSEHLLNPAEFWTPWPVPSTSVDDASFSAEAEWKGKRHVCPWNGRTWPMTNSHVAEALAHAARTLDPALKPRAVALIRKCVGLLFWDGDPRRPNTFEHYNPFTGQPSAYRAIDDYQHSWIVDLLLRELVGVRPALNGVWIDPLPFGLAFHCSHIHVRGHWLSVSYNESEGFRVACDGTTLHQSAAIEPVWVEV
ncbi:MAG: hypothetical protein MUD01_09230 [Chloroflexaceae bacterium]|jgi:hypothetical protein|nr:hypothetical protein [Chloroflexaceae bacterium]